jgi:hypothetical protein
VEDKEFKMTKGAAKLIGTSVLRYVRLTDKGTVKGEEASQYLKDLTKTISKLGRVKMDTASKYICALMSIYYSGGVSVCFATDKTLQNEFKELMAERIN